jgi:Ni,Fe-hydrogenase III large subunit
VEKISENRSYIKCVPYYDRTDYIAAVSNVYGYLLGVEAMMQIEVPKRAQYIRIMMTEFSRISSHLLWLATHAIDIGAMTVFLYCFREREEILKLFEALFGARLTTHAFRVGGLWKDLPAGFEEAARKFIDEFPERVDEYEQLLTKNRIWLARTQGIGVISGKEAIEWGLTGPVLRGSGMKHDVRRIVLMEDTKNSISMFRWVKTEIPTIATWFAWRRCTRAGESFSRYWIGCPMDPFAGRHPRLSNRPWASTIRALTALGESWVTILSVTARHSPFE